MVNGLHWPSPLFFYPQMEVSAMTGIQKQNAQVMRSQGASPSQIADALGLSVNTVKSYLRRCRLSSTSKETGNEADKEKCKHCGKRLAQNPKLKSRKFCSDACCDRWWNAHRVAKSQKAVPTTCACCGTLFMSYPFQKRKYCSRDCYFASRFGKGVSS